jgi:hypothetical protein
MKKIISTIIVSLATISFATSQTEFDALKFIQPEINGTARYTSMAGAFGALGGDASAIKDNPAGLGIYRSSELTGTFSALTQETSSSWRNGGTSTEGFYKPGFNNLTYVLSIPVSSSPSSNANLVRSNFAFSFNRLKDFERNVKVNGGSGSTSSITDYLAYFTGTISGNDLYEVTGYNPYNNTSVPWMSVMVANAGLIYEDAGSSYWNSLLEPNETVSPYYSLREQGYLNEFAISWSGNFSNKLFLGTTLNFYDLNYRSDSEYKESFSLDGNMSLLNTFRSNATGVGLKLGAIYAPLDYVRFGLSMQTPVIFTVKDIHYADLKYAYNTNSGPTSGTIYSPEGDNTYKLQGPMVYNLSASFILGNKGVIGVELVNSHNSGSKFMDVNNSTFDYGYENDSISVLFTTQQMIKIGGEYKLTNNFSVRAGYAIATPATLSRIGKEFIPNTLRTDLDYFVQNGNTNYLTAGVGYRESNWYIDLALINKTYSEKFYPYNYGKLDASYATIPGNVNTSNLSIVTTLGFRF